jgi:hypothetical protein
VVVGIWGGSCPTLPSGYCFTDCTKEAYYRIVCEGVSSKVLHEDLTVFAGLEANFSLHIWNSPEITRLGGNIFAAVANFILHVELQNLRHLQMLPEVVDMSNLRQLIIRGTPLLKQFPLEALPNSRKIFVFFSSNIFFCAIYRELWKIRSIFSSFCIKN